jgi:hypothetical protein
MGVKVNRQGNLVNIEKKRIVRNIDSCKVVAIAGWWGNATG